LTTISRVSSPWRSQATRRGAPATVEGEALAGRLDADGDADVDAAREGAVEADGAGDGATAQPPARATAIAAVRMLAGEALTGADRLR
jgi:hypothetical protein